MKLNLLPKLSSQFEQDLQSNLRKRQHLGRNPVRGGHVYRNATDATAPPISGQFPSGKLAGNWAGSGFQRTRVSIDMATPNGVPESRRMINCMFLAVLLL